jgi:SsrA-binding protein
VSAQPSRKSTSDEKIAATNRRAHHDYSIEATWEAGMMLVGSEVKSLREGACNLGDGYVMERNGELWLLNVHIQEYAQANRFNHEPLRPRKLLLNHREIEVITRLIREKGRVIVPLRIYFKEGRAKLEIGAGVGKKLHDKRESIKERDAEREMLRMKRTRGQVD